MERCVVALGLLVFLTVHPATRSLPLTTDIPFDWDLPVDNDTSADNFIDDSDDALANQPLAHSTSNEVGSYTTDLPIFTTDAPLTEAPTVPQFVEELSEEPTSTEPSLTGLEPIDVAPTEATTSEKAPDWTTTIQPEETTLPSQKTGRSLMVVLPYAANNLTENGIQELATKTPLTRIIGNEPSGEPDIQFKEPTTTTSEPSSTTQSPPRRKPSRRPHPSRRRPSVPINHKPEFAEPTMAITRLSTTATTVKSTTPRPLPVKPSMSSPIRDNVKDLLASIGLSPMPETKPVMPVYTKTTTTTTTQSPDTVDVSSAAESLTPEMKDILKSIGLLHEGAVASSFAPPTIPSPIITTQPIVPEVDPSSYVQFKPLPLKPSAGREGVKVSNDMQEFLASFGLLPNVGPIRITSTPDEYFDINEMSKNRKSKALKGDAATPPSMEMPKIDPDMFTPDMKDVLGDLGLIKSASEEQSTSDHIFNPVEHSAKLSEKGEAEKVIKLLSSIKDLPNDTQADTFTAVAEPYKAPKFRPKSKKKKPVKEKLEENNGPSPLSLEELRLFLEDSKNEVKRQQPIEVSSNSTAEESEGPDEPFFPEDFNKNLSVTVSTRNSATTTTTTTTSTTTTTTTEAIPPVNVDALADSFGGQGDNPKGGSELPPTRPNGLYFLLDWNTFFNVGEEGKNPVKLNFSPRIGDPKRFIPVVVP